MSFSFLNEMQIALPDSLAGTARFKAINKMIAYHISWQQEAQSNLKQLLSEMKNFGALDMDFGGPGSNGKIWYRIYGDTSPKEDERLLAYDEVTSMLLSVLTNEQKVLLFGEKYLVFSLSMQFKEGKNEHRFRGSVYYESNTLVANFRRINEKLLPLKALGYPEIIYKRLNLQYEKSGLYLMTGITGSGKTYSLDTIIDMNNRKNKALIIVIDDPIEYMHQSEQCIIRHREIGKDVKNYEQATEQVLTLDPDIIVVGEMRNRQVVTNVLEAADTGYKVFSTLHTSSAIESIKRIVSEFPQEEQDRVRFRLADILKVIISQKLVPDKFGKLVLCKEILSVDASVQAAIRNNNLNEIYQMMIEGKKIGMLTLEQDLYANYIAGKISRESALNYANNKKRLKHLFKYSI